MFPVLLDLGFFKVPAYGFFVALGYLAAIMWLRGRKAGMGLDEDRFWFVVYAVFIGALAGGKLMFLAVEYRRLLSGELRSFSDLRYGFVFFGGFFGACLAGLFCRRRLGIGYLGTADFFGPALALGHAVGRLGCLASGCCYGRPTGLPWGVRLGGHPLSTTPTELWGVPLHPVQVYEALGNAVIALLLIKLVLPRVPKAWAPGTVFLAYVVLYSCLRFSVEFFRGDDRGMWLGLSVAQWTALGCLAAAGLSSIGIMKYGSKVRGPIPPLR
ncbi:MAG: prolipoprotein diacylglyceryl transferase [Elusimicrobia bacterium]|nr:prolipoprotein diacylglyceryl transferase [Elusimicrobiota bacterium]